jgi:LysM repeat protein
MTLESGTRFNLCLPKTCTTAQAGATDDCWSISLHYNISFAQFKAFNPTINSDCTNLRPNGTVVCVSSPDGSYTPVSLPGSNSSWSQGEYADTIVSAPGSTAFGTTTKCGAYYQVQTADTCRRISIAAKVSVELFQEINPSIDEDCTNLVPGLWYCVHPTYNWNDVPSDGSTPTSTTVAPPSPTPTGTTSECYKWHVVVLGDNCDLLRNTLGITMAQLVSWNPDLKTDCSNLILGDAYCVQGPSVTVPATTTTAAGTSTSTTSTSTTSTNTAPTSTPSSSTCAQTYTVASGDWCSKIWEQFGLSESDFRSLNPSLNANCDLSIGQVLCVAAPSTCAATYTVVSGDWCSKIWEQFGLTEAQFRALNPSVNANCDINIGQKLCVG